MARRMNSIRKEEETLVIFESRRPGFNPLERRWWLAKETAAETIPYAYDLLPVGVLAQYWDCLWPPTLMVVGTKTEKDRSLLPAYEAANPAVLRADERFCRGLRSAGSFGARGSKVALTKTRDGQKRCIRAKWYIPLSELQPNINKAFAGANYVQSGPNTALRPPNLPRTSFLTPPLLRRGRCHV
ncbi:hypothetical protein BDP27DRAFT_1367890 [Rhodocollybia butyracea]|uniref:Uncharacterized protein n=1 Tax=Rhodocollybia butyracea TaxID=206335 RepID=A0A9P5PKB0_9AGAR|nr:hypothetical protein BDP27DRAFT_1367890 [Rhodocollybia butyracea]